MWTLHAIFAALEVLHLAARTHDAHGTRSTSLQGDALALVPTIVLPPSASTFATRSILVHPYAASIALEVYAGHIMVKHMCTINKDTEFDVHLT